MTPDVLFSAIKQWGRDKGINNPTVQFAKINEEVGELAHELVRGYCGGYGGRVPSQETVDAIGDIIITVIIFADIVGVDPLGASCAAPCWRLPQTPESSAKKRPSDSGSTKGFRWKRRSFPIRTRWKSRGISRRSDAPTRFGSA